MVALFFTPFVLRIELISIFELNNKVTTNLQEILF